MTMVLVLRHHRLPPVHLTLAGSTLITHINAVIPNVQSFPSREAAKEHLERVLRLRTGEGYRVLNRNEIAGDDAPIVDLMQRFIRLDAEPKRVYVDLAAEPISPEELAEVATRLVAAAPSCIHHIRSDENPGGLFGAALAGKAIPSAKSLVYNALIPQDHYRLPLDDLADLLAALPNLQRVSADGRYTLREAKHGVLRELHLESTQMLPGTIAALGRGALPALTTLGLVLGNEHGLDRGTAGALRSLGAPHLQAIQVAKLEDVARFLDELTEGALPPSWVMLYAHGSIGDEDDLLAVLRERAPALRALAMVGLPLADHLCESAIAEAKALLPTFVDVSDLPELWQLGESDSW